MKSLLSKKALKYLSELAENIEHKEDGIKIIKEIHNTVWDDYTNYKILKDDKVWFEKEKGRTNMSNMGYAVTNYEKMNILDGVCRFNYHERKENLLLKEDKVIIKFCKEDYEIEGDSFKLHRKNNDHFINCRFTLKDNIFSTIGNFKIAYDIKEDSIYITIFNHTYKVDMEDKTKLINDIIQKQNDYQDNVIEEIKNSVKDILDKNNLDINISKYEYDTLNEILNSHLKITLSDDNKKELVYIINNIKDCYLKLATFKNNEHLILDEINSLNDLLEKYYDLEQPKKDAKEQYEIELEREQEKIKQKLKKKYLINN